MSGSRMMNFCTLPLTVIEESVDESGTFGNFEARYFALIEIANFSLSARLPLASSGSRRGIIVSFASLLEAGAEGLGE
jgi:hypothetical protein